MFLLLSDININSVMETFEYCLVEPLYHFGMETVFSNGRIIVEGSAQLAAWLSVINRSS